MKLNSFVGPVLQEEIDMVVHWIDENSRIATSNADNAYVYGVSGSTMEALGLLYEISFKSEILNRFIQYCEGALDCRNNPIDGEVIWTGKRDLVWTLPSTGAGQGDIIGHIAYCSKLILSTPSLWDIDVPVGNSQYGKTYKEKALKFISECELTTQQYLMLFVDSEKNHRYYFPDHIIFKNPKQPVPWNQQMMLNNAFHRLAECHELLGDNSTLVDNYHFIVQTSLDWLIEHRICYYYLGHEVCRWAYAPHLCSIGKRENMSHGNYDMWGLFRAFQSKRYNLTADQIKPFINTVTKVMIKGNRQYATTVYVKDDDTDVAYWMHSGFLSFLLFEPQLFVQVAADNQNCGGRQTKNANMTSTTLFIKHHIYLESQM